MAEGARAAVQVKVAVTLFCPQVKGAAQVPAAAALAVSVPPAQE
jgi:hypothetical protein